MGKNICYASSFYFFSVGFGFQGVGLQNLGSRVRECASLACSVPGLVLGGGSQGCLSQEVEDWP